MKNFRTIYLIAFFITGMFFIQSCKKDDLTPAPTNQDFSFGNSVQRDFIGVVNDQSNVPISGATVNIGSKTAVTDAKGVFVINNATVKERFAYVEVTKGGYLKGLKTVVPTENASRVDLILLTETVQALPSNNEIQLASGAKVTFSGGFEDANGSPFTGAVNYSINYIDPVSPTIANEMPGMLLGNSSENAFEILQTFGMLHVNLTDGSGNSLQIASGETAEIRMPIPSALSSFAPATIPLWSFDEVAGYWVEEGSANKVGSEYVGNVSHFSWWNCDLGFPVTLLCLEVEDVNGNPIGNVNVDLSFTGNPFLGEGTSNEYGQICGGVPTGESITLTAYDDCGNTLVTDVIGPYTSITTVETLVIPNSSNLQTVLGNFLDCNGALITDGYLEYNYGGIENIQYIDNGVFEFSTLICNGSTSGFLEGIDYNNSQTTGLIPFVFNQPATNLGNIISCNTIDEYITYQVDGGPSVTTVQVASEYNSITGGFSVSGIPNSPNSELYFSTQSTTLGTYSWGDYNSFLAITEIDLNNAVNSQNLQFSVNNFGLPTEFVDVVFYGTIVDDNNVTKSLTGTIHVRRDS